VKACQAPNVDETCLHDMVVRKPSETLSAVTSSVALSDVSIDLCCCYLGPMQARDAAHVICHLSWLRRSLIHAFVQCGSCAAELPGRLAGPLLPRLHLHGVVQHPDHGPSGRVGY